MPSPSPEAVERLVDQGLRNLWYPILPGRLVTNKPVGITRLGERPRFLNFS